MATNFSEIIIENRNFDTKSAAISSEFIYYYRKYDISSGSFWSSFLFKFNWTKFGNDRKTPSAIDLILHAYNCNTVRFFSTNPGFGWIWDKELLERFNILNLSRFDSPSGISGIEFFRRSKVSNVGWPYTSLGTLFKLRLQRDNFFLLV